MMIVYGWMKELSVTLIACVFGQGKLIVYIYLMQDDYLLAFVRFVANWTNVCFGFFNWRAGFFGAFSILDSGFKCHCIFFLEKRSSHRYQYSEESLGVLILSNLPRSIFSIF